ncbi:MAG TPA: response regulator [Hyphomonadaceae bacterium]|jgi:CheY-like chemotaxis protein|nr:response regulator [Hyphomonadaceae bacterium]
MTLKILIVDDSRLARMSVIRALSRLRPDFTYIEAGHPDEAITLMKGQGAQAAIVDFNMPGRDGLALTSELRAIDPDIPVAVLSANAQQEIISRTQQLGATFLTKPLTEPALDAFLIEAATRQRK